MSRTPVGDARDGVACDVMPPGRILQADDGMPPDQYHWGDKAVFAPVIAIRARSADERRASSPGAIANDEHDEDVMHSSWSRHVTVANIPGCCGTSATLYSPG